MKKLTKDEISAVLAQPNGAEKLCSMNVDMSSLLENAKEMFTEEGAASALLLRLANKKPLLINLCEDAAFVEAARAALSAESAKLRRNAARLLGAMRVKDAAGDIIAALNGE